MIVAMPLVSEGAETTMAYEATCAAGPLALVDVTTGLYESPQPAIRATAVSAAPACTKRCSARHEFIEKSLIRNVLTYLVIVNQRAGENAPAKPVQVPTSFLDARTPNK
jgi:hypothetical protein